MQRHEQAFYSFVHNVHAKGQGLFDSLMAWIELFLSYARDGLGEKLDLEILLPMDGPQRQAIMKEVDAVAQYHYKLKVAHEEKIRRRFQANVDQQSLEEAALVDSVMASLSIGDTAVNAAGEIAVEESEEESDGEGDDMSETSSVMSQSSLTRSHAQEKHTHGSHGTPHGHSHGHAHLLDKRKTSVQDEHAPPLPPKDKPKKRRKRAKTALVPPETPMINELRPVFVEVVSDISALPANMQVKQLLVVKPLTV